MSSQSNSGSGGSAAAMDEYRRQVNVVLDSLDEKLSAYPTVQLVAAQTKLRPSYLAVALTLFATLFIFWGFGGRLVANLVGFGYPLYESFNSLKRKPAPGIVDEEDSQWLTYWVVYSTFTLVESFSNFLELWIPLYHLVKIAFLLWCMLPQTKGALFIYRAVIEPILVRYEGRIDAGSSRVKKSASTVVHDFESAGEDVLEYNKRELVDSAINSLVGGQQPAPGGPITEHSKAL